MTLALAEATAPNIQLDIRDIERRLLRAFMTMRAMPDPDKRFQNFQSLWPEFKRSASEAYGYEETKLPRFRPTPSDISDCLNALSWMRGIEEDGVKIILMRSLRLSFRRIGQRFHKSDETARRWYKDLLLNVWRNASLCGGGYYRGG